MITTSCSKLAGHHPQAVSIANGQRFYWQVPKYKPLVPPYALGAKTWSCVLCSLRTSCCSRQLVAEWLQTELGILVPEYVPAEWATYTGSMSNQFKVGDVVELKSGSCPMTVRKVSDKGILCVWCSGTTFWEASFAPDELTAVSEGGGRAERLEAAKKRVHAKDQPVTIISAVPRPERDAVPPE